jgi:hypothetical protein
MVERNVSPKHQPAIVGLEQIANAIQMLEVNCADSFRLRCFSALPFAELECFIFADVKELAGE